MTVFLTGMEVFLLITVVMTPLIDSIPRERGRISETVVSLTFGGAMTPETIAA